MGPNSWVIESLNMMGIAKKMVNFLGDEVLEGGANL